MYGYNAKTILFRVCCILLYSGIYVTSLLGALVRLSPHRCPSYPHPLCCLCLVVPATGSCLRRSSAVGSTWPWVCMVLCTWIVVVVPCTLACCRWWCPRVAMASLWTGPRRVVVQVVVVSSGTRSPRPYPGMLQVSLIRCLHGGAALWALQRRGAGWVLVCVVWVRSLCGVVRRRDRLNVVVWCPRRWSGGRRGYYSGGKA